MHVLTEDILKLSTEFISTFCLNYGVDPDDLYEPDVMQRLPDEGKKWYSQALDLGAAGWIASKAKTFLFSHQQTLEFMRAIDRKFKPGDYYFPFDEMSIQFDKGIDESLFTVGLKPDGDKDEGDQILSLLIAFPKEEGANYINVVAWYKSTSINRIQLPIHGDGTIDYNPVFGDANDPIRRNDKQRICNLAMLCIAYITARGVTIEHVATPDKVNRKRERDGKRRLPDYYICKWHNPTSGKKAVATGTGTSHSFRYDVARHIRIMADGRLVRVQPHQRGLKNELYIPNVRQVD